MAEFLDALQDAVAWVVTSTILALLTWATWITRTVMANKTRLAVLEETVGKVPTQLEKIDEKLDEMREGAHEGRERLYRHIDNVRKELKLDIKDARH